MVPPPGGSGAAPGAQPVDGDGAGPTRRFPAWLWAVGGLLVGLAVGAGIGVAVGGGDDTTSASRPSPTTATSGSPTTPTTRPTTTTTAAPYDPTPADFTIEVIELTRSCFGSAGCTITYTIEPSYIGPQPPNPRKTYTVIYQLDGGETPKTGNFTVTGGRMTYQQEDFISTPPNPVLSVTPQRVLAQ
jgi:hypothetical protein